METVHSTQNGSTVDSAAEFYEDLKKHDVGPLWLSLDKLLTKTPKPAATPMLWKYADIRPKLMRSGEIISAEEAERRVLMLLNPSLQAPFATDSIYAGLQLILPQETAPAHRHSPFALRYIIEGRGGFTAVNGEKLVMEPGDLILAPSGHWHDHGNDGDGPVVWLDGLDLPVFKFLALGFTEQYPEPRMPSKPTSQSAVHFPWAPVEETLQQCQGLHATYHYVNSNGEPISRALGAQAERIAPGGTSAATRGTFSFVYHVVKGRGRTLLLSPGNAQELQIEWQPGDTFAVPAWTRVQHMAAASEACLFAINDRPLIQSLGLAVTIPA